MAKILSNKKSTYGGPYAYYSCEVTQKSRTPEAVVLNAKASGYLQYSNSWLGTGAGYGLIAGLYIAGAWRTWTLKGEGTKWTGRTVHSASRSITIPASAATSALSAKFRVRRTITSYEPASLNSTTCSNIAITNVVAKFGEVALSCEALSQAQVKAKVSGIPASTGYAYSINWYCDGKLVATTPVSGSAAVTEYECTISGLKPSTSYAITADIKYTGDSTSILDSEEVYVVTPAETGALTLTPKATYMSINVAGMFELPNYDRNIEVYYKKAEESNYKLLGTFKEQSASLTTTVTGLSSNEKYDIQVLIKSGSTTLLTLNKSATTLMDTSLIPTGIIDRITQKLGTRECTVEWQVDKAVAGTNYDIQARVVGTTEWTSLLHMTDVVSPAVVTAHDGNVDMEFRILSWNFDVVDGTSNYSDVYKFYVRDDFVWDVEKVAGGVFVITAAEWNRLREYVISRNSDIGVSVDIAQVRPGDSITAEVYNTMKNAVNNICDTGVDDKRRGDAISAADIDILRVSINTVDA